MKVFLNTLGLLIATQFAFAQTTDISRFALDISLNGNITEGNLARWILINRLDIAYQLADGFFSLDHSDYYVYGRIQGREFENNILDRTFFNVNTSGTLIPFAALFLESYPVRNQNFRWQSGFGLKYILAESKGLLVQSAIMLSYSEQQFRTSSFKEFDNEGSDEINTVFLTPIVNLNVPLFNNKLMLVNTFWYQIDLNGDKNHRSFYDGKIVMKLNKSLSFQTLITNYWENIVQQVRGSGPQGPPIEKNDFVLSYGIAFNVSQ